MTRADAYLHAKFHLDRRNRLATIHQRYRQTGQTGQDRQRSDSIGRTVLQTLAQKFNKRSAVGEMSDRLATIYMGGKEWAAVPLWGGVGSPIHI